MAGEPRISFQEELRTDDNESSHLSLVGIREDIDRLFAGHQETVDDLGGLGILVRGQSTR